MTRFNEIRVWKKKKRNGICRWFNKSACLRIVFVLYHRVSNLISYGLSVFGMKHAFLRLIYIGDDRNHWPFLASGNRIELVIATRLNQLRLLDISQTGFLESVMWLTQGRVFFPLTNLTLCQVILIKMILTQVILWINKSTLCLWDVITRWCLTFNGGMEAAFEVRAWMNNHIPSLCWWNHMSMHSLLV